ncbi:MAG: hypothetical protein J1D87_09170, partial [Lachnospiraceae bacterium]|nr:hypothetical protein [Lachnospiraceae bacterium]
CILFLAAVFVPLGQQEVYASQEQSTKILNNTTHRKEQRKTGAVIAPVAENHTSLHSAYSDRFS